MVGIDELITRRAKNRHQREVAEWLRQIWNHHPVRVTLKRRGDVGRIIDGKTTRLLAAR